MLPRQKTGGRKVGTPNKLTSIFKQALTDSFDPAKFREWSNENQTEYYKILAKVMPNEIFINPQSGITLKVKYVGRSNGNGSHTS